MSKLTKRAIHYITYPNCRKAKLLNRCDNGKSKIY